MKRITISLFITLIALILPLRLNLNPTRAQSTPTLLLQARLSQGTWYALWSPDSQKVVVYKRSYGALQVLDVRAGQSLYQFPAGIDIQAVVWSPDSNRLFIGSPDGIVYIIDMISGNRLAELHHPDTIFDIHVSSDGQRVLVSGGFSTAIAWESTTGEILYELTPSENIIRTDWDEGRQRIMTYSDDGAFSVWDMSSGDYLFTLHHQFAIYGSTWNTAGTQVITYGQDRTARITNAATGATLLEIEHDDVVNNAVWLPDQSHIMTATNDSKIHVWSLNGALVRTLPYRGITLLTNDTHVLSQNRETLQIWDIDTGEEVLAFLHESFVQDYTLNPDHSRLLSWTVDGVGRLWNTTTGAATFQFEDVVRTGAWSPDGSRLLLITDENRLQVWLVP